MPFLFSACKGDMNGVNQGRGCWWRKLESGHSCRFCGMPKDVSPAAIPNVPAPAFVPRATAF